MDKSISENTIKLINDFQNKNISILKSFYANSLIKQLYNKIKCNNDLLSLLIKTLESESDHYIKLPNYKLSNKRKIKNNELILEDNGKYGILIKVISNKKTFNFSIRIMDYTVIKYDNELKQQQRGSYRSYNMTDRYGNISSNWKVLKILELDEKSKIFDNHDKHSIHSYEIFIDKVVGDLVKNIRYFLLKLYIKRLENEKLYWTKLQKEIENDTSKNK